jgi:hypothetical protein
MLNRFKAVAICLAVSLAASTAQAQRIAGDNAPLPGGWGNARQGMLTYANKCAYCHEPPPTKTARPGMENCWNDPAKMFWYVKENMPNNPQMGSLTNSEVYGLVAYMLLVSRITKRNDILNAKTLRNVVLPGQDGMIPAGCPVSAGGIGKFAFHTDHSRKTVPAPPVIVLIAPASRTNTKKPLVADAAGTSFSFGGRSWPAFTRP